MRRERDKQINFRLSAEELSIFDENVKRSNLKKSEYLRRCILEKDIIVIEDIKDMVLELKEMNKLLDNISSNQSDSSEDKEDIIKIKKDINKLFLEAVTAMRKVNE